MYKVPPFSQCICCLCLFLVCLPGMNLLLYPPVTWATVTAKVESVPDRSLQDAREQNAELQRLIGERKFDEALPMAERILAAREQALGPEHPEVATVLTRLATILRSKPKPDLPQALSLNQRALKIAERVPAPGHPELGQIVKEIGVIQFRFDDLAQAETSFLRALSIWEPVFGPNDPKVIGVLNNLAAVYGSKNDFLKARPILQRLVTITEQTQGAEHPSLIPLLINLGTTYSNEYKFAQAEPLFQRAVKLISQKTPGQETALEARGISSLANILVAKGEFAQAETLYRRAQAIFERTLGKESQEYADSLASIAINYSYQGKLAEAEPLQQQALGIIENAFGPKHPKVAERLNSLTRIYLAQGNFDKAITTQTRASQVSEQGLAYNLDAAGSEREKLLYLSTFADETDQAISLHNEFAPSSEAARNLALTTILRRKARALDSLIDSLAVLRQRATPEDRDLLDQLRKTRKQIADLALQPSNARTEQQKKVLDEQREKLEDQISRRSAEFRAQTQPVTLAAIQAAIPDRAALVEFVVYRQCNPKSNSPLTDFGEPRYAAYVMQRTGAERWVNLGSKRVIDDAIQKLRQALRNRHRRDVKQLARTVDKLVMQPLRPLLGTARHVLVAPDGSLNLVPFAALVDEGNQYLVHLYTFGYLSSGRDLLRLGVKAQRKRSAMIITNPDFGSSDGKASNGQRILRYRPAAPGEPIKDLVLADAYFPPLPATEGEARSLKKLMPESQVLSLKQATESALKQISAPDILHVATHGFFLGDLNESGQRSPMLTSDAAARAANPLLRSGLALAGANTLMSGDEDGILTALEAASLNLWGTRLVVLSACDTGVGEVKNGEGVFGLRRALLLAGSETQVMSLWPVSDRGTRELMTDYYRRLQRGEGRAEALRAVQLRLLRADAQPNKAKHKHDYSHPYYWASFIQSGEWANLDGQR